LSDHDARNIAALARVYGVIRAFVASDEAIFAYWNRLSRKIVRDVGAAKYDTELIIALEDAFESVCPELRVVSFASLDQVSRDAINKGLRVATTIPRWCIGNCDVLMPRLCGHAHEHCAA